MQSSRHVLNRVLSEVGRLCCRLLLLARTMQLQLLARTMQLQLLAGAMQYAVL
jgi:hypothetical protein